MTDTKSLRELAEAASMQSWSLVANANFQNVANPHAVIALLDEVARLREALMFIDKISLDSGGKTEFKMNRIWHITQQALATSPAQTEEKKND